jgi:hypothetical protein
MVANSVMEYFYNDARAPKDPRERLRQAIERASLDVYEEARRRKNNMASTIVAALIFQGKLTIANVGDSPALLIRRNRPPQKLTVDHIRIDRDGSQSLAQAIGDAEISVALFTTDFQTDDVVVLCSAGLTDLLTPDRIKRIIHGRSARDATRSLIWRANARGGHDNITALVIRNGTLPLLAQKKAVQAIGAGVAALLIAGLLVFALPSLLRRPASDAAPQADPAVATFAPDINNTIGTQPPTSVLLTPSNTATPTTTLPPPPTQRPKPAPTRAPSQANSPLPAPAVPTPAAPEPTQTPAPPPLAETPTPTKRPSKSNDKPKKTSRPDPTKKQPTKSPP